MRGLCPEQYAGHSIRIGAATAAAIAGVEDSTILMLGRRNSAALLRFVHSRILPDNSHRK